MGTADKPAWFVLDEQDWSLLSQLKGQSLQEKLQERAIDFGDVLIERWLYDAVNETYHLQHGRDWLEYGELTVTNQTRCFEYHDCQRLIRDFKQLKKQWQVDRANASFAATFQQARDAQRDRPAAGSDQEKEMLYRCATSMEQWLIDVIPSCVGVLLKG